MPPFAFGGTVGMRRCAKRKEKNRRKKTKCVLLVASGASLVQSPAVSTIITGSKLANHRFAIICAKGKRKKDKTGRKFRFRALLF